VLMISVFNLWIPPTPITAQVTSQSEILAGKEHNPGTAPGSLTQSVATCAPPCPRPPLESLCTRSASSPDRKARGKRKARGQNPRGPEQTSIKSVPKDHSTDSVASDTISVEVTSSLLATSRTVLLGDARLMPVTHWEYDPVLLGPSLKPANKNQRLHIEETDSRSRHTVLWSSQR